MSRARIGLAFIFLAFLVMLALLRSFQIVQISIGDGILFRVAYTSASMMLLSALLLVISAILIATSNTGLVRFFGLLPLFLALILSGAAYETFMDRLVVGSKMLVLPSRGFPVHRCEQLPYDQISEVKIQTDRRGPDNSQPRFLFNFHRTDGTNVIVPIGDLH